MAKPFPHAFIQNVQGPKPSSAVQRVTHEVHRPHGIRLRDDDEGLTAPNREPLLRPTWQIQPELAVHSPQPFVIPGMAIEVRNRSIHFQKPQRLLARHERREGRDHRRIPPGPVHEGPIVRGAPQSHRATGPLNRKAVHRDQVGHDLPPLSGP